MRVAIMQPYFLPYLGYYQLMRSVDAFVVYDNIQFTKKGWIHRNRMLVNNEAAMFTLPLKNDEGHLDIVQRELADDYPNQADRLIRRFEAAYRAAPFFETTLSFVRACFSHSERNLFRFLLHSIRLAATKLEVSTPIVVSSSVAIDPSLRGEDRVLATCQALGATCYVNPPGGRSLYHTSRFADRGIQLRFLEPELPPYSQFGAPFVSHLSIADVLMFNPPSVTADWLGRASSTPAQPEPAPDTEDPMR